MTYETATIVGCSILVLGGPIGLALVAALIRRRDFGELPVRLLVIGGILASGLIFCFGGILFHWLFPPPYVPALSNGRGLDLRGFLFGVAGWAGGISTFALALAYGYDLNRERRGR